MIMFGISRAQFVVTPKRIHQRQEVMFIKRAITYSIRVKIVVWAQV
jgi:hypothetical protein